MPRPRSRRTTRMQLDQIPLTINILTWALAIADRPYRFLSQGPAIVSLAIIFFSIAAPADTAYATITLSPGINIQSAVNSNPAGSTFILGRGTYRMQTVVPKTGDRFTGQTGAILNGSELLHNWLRSGSYWTSAGAPALNNPFGDSSRYCADATTGCAYPRICFSITSRWSISLRFQ
jgi:hypothetical protein